MRNLVRNQRPFWYCLYNSSGTFIDEDGNDTGVPVEQYESPVKAYGNISAASGSTEQEQFGIGVTYDKTIQLPGTGWPITESTLLFVDHEPPEDFDAQNVPADYAVVRKSVSLNQTSLAVKRLRDG